MPILTDAKIISQETVLRVKGNIRAQADDHCFVGFTRYAFKFDLPPPEPEDQEFQKKSMNPHTLFQLYFRKQINPKLSKKKFKNENHSK